MRRPWLWSWLWSLAMVACTGLSISGQLSAQNWPRFRGPNGAGVSSVSAIPTHWTAEDYRWTAALPGGGHSSPVVWGQRLFITSADPQRQERFLLCYDTTSGDLLWQQTYPFARFKKHAGNSFASTTPAVDADHVYVVWQSAQQSAVYALTHAGQPVWKFELGKYKSGHGTGSSPIVEHGMVVVCNDHDGDSFLLALDARTGQQRWRTPRVGDRACYSTPCYSPGEAGPGEFIFTHSFRGITGVDAASGKTNWELDVFGRFPQRTIASPILFRDLVIGSSGFTTAEKNVVAVAPRRSDDGPTRAVEVYRLNKQVPHIPTPVIYGERMYLWTDNGIVSCVDAASGSLIWQKRVGGNFFGSPICVHGYLYCVDVDGLVSVVKAQDQYELVAQVPLGETSRATPAVGNGLLLFRSYSRLYALGPESGESSAESKPR